MRKSTKFDKDFSLISLDVVSAPTAKHTYITTHTHTLKYINIYLYLYTNINICRTSLNTCLGVRAFRYVVNSFKLHATLA